MGETFAGRRRLVVAAALGYGAIFVALAALDVPTISITAFFVIPTALIAIAGGPVAGIGGTALAAALGLGAGIIHSDSSGAIDPSLATGGRAAALLCTGVLLGWFAERNRELLSELRVGAERDHLTGLGNHRVYEAALDRRFSARQTFGLLVCDMDRLKDLNDGNGHTAGDEALRLLAVQLRSLARPDDDVARIGGDEFCVVATVRDAREVEALAARLQAALAEAGCSATFGWATHPADGRSKDDLFRVADERLYARKGGRLSAVGPLAAAG